MWLLPRDEMRFIAPLFAALMVACGQSSDGTPANSGVGTGGAGVGGSVSTGGSQLSATTPVGGASGVGGKSSTGGVVATGGSLTITGGQAASGGSTAIPPATGGRSTTGGSAAVGGTASLGGSATGGTSAANTSATGGLPSTVAPALPAGARGRAALALGELRLAERTRVARASAAIRPQAGAPRSTLAPRMVTHAKSFHSGIP
jgi:hypothetical protein